jgi:hypothetical protein
VGGWVGGGVILVETGDILSNYKLLSWMLIFFMTPPPPERNLRVRKSLDSLDRGLTRAGP